MTGCDEDDRLGEPGVAAGGLSEGQVRTDGRRRERAADGESTTEGKVKQSWAGAKQR